jgi:GNAT superfamily N-acetyltransferase|tara:strand:+ start:49 stop:1188 length:1140 start_codon:yes stop_codon:yes gene_type:complete
MKSDSNITIKEVTNSDELKKFVMFPHSLYKDSKYWVAPIIKEELEILNKETNPVFNNATAHYFLAYIDGKIVGRIAALINWIEVKDLKKKKVRFGWFDFIDDKNVSKYLLEKVIEIGTKYNLEFIEGPVGFSNMDKAGMLIKGFEKKNTMITMYNYSYYQDHMKSHGYSKLAEWVEYELKIANYDDSPEKVKKFSDLILKRYNLKKLNFTSTEQIVPYVDQMFYLLGKTYDKLQTFVPIQEYQIDYYKNRFLKYINPGFIKCVTDENDELVAFAITMPSFSNALKKIKGKVDLIGKLRLLHAKNYNSKGSLYLIGVRPDFQNKGVIAILFNELQKFYNKFGITEVETNPELIENTAIQQLWKNYENNQHKNRATFTKQI